MKSSTLSLSVVLSMAVLVGLFLPACSTGPKLVNMWYDNEYQGAQLQNFVIVGVSNEEGRRRLFEDTFAATMQQRGIETTPSYKLFEGVGKLDQEQLQQMVAAAGADGVLVTRLVAVDQKASYQPGYTTAAPGYYYNFYGYYDHAYGAVSTPGYVYEYEVVRLETNLYEVADWDLLWSGTTETVDFDTIEREVPRLADLIMKSLADKGLL